MTSMTMTPEEFRDLLDTHGSDLAVWPEAERRAAEVLLAAVPESRDMLAAARALDEAMRAIAPKRPAHLVDRIMRVAGAEPKSKHRA